MRHIVLFLVMAYTANCLTNHDQDKRIIRDLVKNSDYPWVDTESEDKVKIQFNKDVKEEVIKNTEDMKFLEMEEEIKTPYLIKRNYGNKDLINYSQRWDWSDDYYKVLEIEARIHDNFVGKYKEAISSAKGLPASNNDTINLAKEKAKFIASNIISNIPRKCNSKENLNKIETILFELCKSNEKFDIEQLKIKLKTFIDNLKSKNITIEESETEELSNLILSSVNELDEILNRIDGEVRENMISDFKNYCISMIKQNQFQYTDLLNQLNSKIQKMIQAQEKVLENTKINKNSTNFDIIIKRKQNEPFMLTIKEIIDNKREDHEWFELITMSKLKSSNSFKTMNDDFINVSSLALSGVTSSQIGEYKYNLSLRYTFIKDGSHQIYPLSFVIIVCDEIDRCGESEKDTNSDSPTRTIVIISGIVIIILVVFTGIFYVIFRNYGVRRSFRSYFQEDSTEMNKIAQGSDV